MKKISDIIGLNIITIREGLEIGIINSVLINAQTAKVEYFATEKGVSLLKSKVICTKDIEGIGDHAITVSNDKRVFDINEVQEAVELANNRVELIFCKAITKKGKDVGEVIDVIIDDESECIITAVQILLPNNKTIIYPANLIITYGQKYLIVEELGGQEIVNPIFDKDKLHSDSKMHYNFIPNLLKIKNLYMWLKSTKNKDMNVEEIQIVDAIKDKKLEKTEKIKPIVSSKKKKHLPQKDTRKESMEKKTILEETTIENGINIGNNTTNNAISLEEKTADNKIDLKETMMDEVINTLSEIVENVSKSDKKVGSAQNKDNKKNNTSKKRKKSAGKDVKEFIETQKDKYILGKISDKTILDSLGEIIVEHGQEIDARVIEKAKSSGKFLEMIKSLQK